MKNIPAFILTSLLSLGLVLTAASEGVETPTTNRIEKAAPKTAAKVINTRPVANAGPDVTINSDRYHLDASQSYDPNGLANCDLLWTKIAGPPRATISHPTAAITPIIDLNMGVYTLRLTITTHDGATSSDEVVITVPAQQVKDKIDEYITKQMEKSDVKGMSIAIIEGGKIVKVKGYGFTDAERTTPVTPRTLFQAASISKVVTAMGALRLVENNRLALDEDVNKKLTSWKVPETEYTQEEKVTLRRLLCHMAGTTVDGFWGYVQGEPVPSLLTVLDGKPPANSAPIRVNAIPGTKTSYSGGGYTIIQQMIIDVSGQPFEEYMRDSVLNKLGMVNSTFEQPLPPSKWDLAASGYTANLGSADPKRRPVPGKWRTHPEMAAAGFWTTAGDLALYVIDIQDTYAGRSSKVITKDMVAKMLTPVPMRNRWKMGLGMPLGGIGGTEAKGSFRASGTNVGSGFQGAFVGNVQTGQGAVVLYNDIQAEMFPELIIQFIAQEYAWPK